MEQETVFKKDILLVEDERESAELLSNFLEMHDFRVLWAEDGRNALNMIDTLADSINLAILDIMVPYVDGRELLRYIRKHPVMHDIPVIFLTAKDEEKDEIKGLELGADDYIPKPASLNLVLAHVQTLLRRRQSSSNWLHYGHVFINRDSREVIADNQTLDLTATEFELLQLFMENPKRVFSRQEILEHISRDDKYVFDRTVDVHIKNLRLKLGEEGDLIKTYRGMGYGLNKDLLNPA
ncbi:MAG TPA: response regulator transcription factor [Balneolales bacterium]|nr:response regulator transcription factor [Balneolales bacterium]